MTARTLTAAILAAALVVGAPASSFAQAYEGSAASTATTLGATASPGISGGSQWAPAHHPSR